MGKESGDWVDAEPSIVDIDRREPGRGKECEGKKEYNSH